MNKLSVDAKSLLSLIPNDGTPIGNTTLQRKSNLHEERYWLLRQELLDLDLIETGRGLGGSVKYITPQQKYPKESDLYGDFEKFLKESYLPNCKIDDRYVLENTSSQGSRKTGGAWTRPDFAIAHIRAFEYSPSKVLEVTTFEIKKTLNESVIGVYAAVSHLAFANRAFLVSLIKQDDRNSDFFQRIIEECTRNGIGWLISYDGLHYEEEIDSKYHTTDFMKVEKFIHEQFAESAKQRLRKYAK